MARPKVKSNEILDFVVRELEECGIDKYEIDESRHFKIIWWSRGRHRTLTSPKTPSDYRSALNTRADLRRQLREDGIFPIKKIKEQRKPRLISTNNPVDLLSHRVDTVASEMSALTDVLLDLAPELSRFNQISDAAASSSQSSDGVKFRLQTDLPPALLGTVMALLVAQGMSLKDIKVMQVMPKTEAVLPYPVIKTVNKPAAEIAPPTTESTTICAAAVPVNPEPAIEPSAPPVQFPATSKAGKYASGANSARTKLLLHLADAGPQTLDQLRAAGLKGYGDRTDRLHILVYKLEMPDAGLVVRYRDGSYNLTPKGRRLAKDFAVQKYRTLAA